jgi:hypothetical protein
MPAILDATKHLGNSLVGDLVDKCCVRCGLHGSGRGSGSHWGLHNRRDHGGRSRLGRSRGRHWGDLRLTERAGVRMNLRLRHAYWTRQIGTTARAASWM